MKLLLFTHSFPYGKQETFLELEVAVLSQIEDLDITIIPRTISAEKRQIPSNIKVDNTYSEYLKKHSEKKIYPIFYHFKWIVKGLIKHRTFGLSAIRDVASFVHYGRNLFNWAKKGVSDDEVILYTYWCDVETYGLSLFKNWKNSHVKLVSRVHRFDLYEENRKHGFIPFRKELISSMDAIFSISRDGQKYLTKKYNQNNIELSFLGVKGDYSIQPTKVDDVVRILSCSFIHPIKRIELIKASLLELTKLRPDQKFEWIHIGGDVSVLDQYFLFDLPSNLVINFKGHLKNEAVHQFYQANYIDAFINLSSSEGIPVSIMEAMIYSIPVVATDVGGVSEIVDDTNGILISMDPEPIDAAEAITRVINNPDFRIGANKTYKTKFDGVLNYQEFADRLLNIRRNNNG